ncbi:MAG: hypothetical protein Q7R49_01535 [Candidatus Daviesbacteria bacterium]|nr:hypothetical protein [Candidatus Daviesbacteria bacterium]
MTSTETASGDYKNRHSKEIHLNYGGVASDLMELSPSIADGFMRVSDMRGDIVIVQKPQDRVRDYEDVGFVRIAKFLKMPRLELWRGDNIMQTRREDDTWLVAINDQELADKVARDEASGKKFDDRFVDAFKTEVNRGLSDCLKREKLFNGGRYNMALGVGYYSLLTYDLLPYPAVVAAGLTGQLDNPVVTIANITALIALVHSAHNSYNLFGAALDYVTDRFLGPSVFKSGLKLQFNDPFVKHSIPELIMPVVPLDRLMRGSRYLTQHGNEIIRSVDISNP